MRFRQIHLDFHTSGQIPGIGSAFDPEAFGAAFKDANVDSVTVFSKCHHGYAYHPTDVGAQHPGLSFDLLRAQIDALHAKGIKAPVYTTATWDEYAATTHPEWRTVAPEGGSPRFLAPPNGAGWAFLDFSTPYLPYLCAQIDEMMQRYPDMDGVFVDICFQLPSVSASAQAQMDAQGLDWTNEADRAKFTAWSVENFFQQVTDTVRKRDDRMPLFFNSGHIRRGMRKHYHDFYTHLELESLPTAGWGYEHFPLSARYVDQLGLPFLGMTGKFHFHWGEVGGYKKPEALIYECGAMLAQGARCSIGDHLHPTGKVDESTMRIIKEAYAWVAEREDWVEGSRNRAEIALLSAEAADQQGLSGIPGHSDHRYDGPDHGAVRVLMEGKFAFDVVDFESDLSGYRLLILPDVIALDAAGVAWVNRFVDQGGHVLMTGKSGLDADGFLFDCGAQWEGTSPMEGGDYLLPVPALQADGVSDPLFMYRPSEQIRVQDGESLGEVFGPYFDRTARHFSGHVNAPSKPKPTGYAAGVRKGAFTYLAHPIFSAYYEVGAVAMLEIAEKAIKSALGRTPMIRTSLPRAGRITLRQQPEQNRDVLHLLHATPALRGNLRGATIQPIQDITPIHDIAVDIHTRGEVERIRLIPSGESVRYTQEGDRVAFSVAEVKGHQMVEIAYR